MKNPITTVFSVFQNLEKPTWFIEKKYFLGGVFPLVGNFNKKGFLDFFSHYRSVCDIQNILNQRKKPFQKIFIFLT
jgi:hypothetical protein